MESTQLDIMTIMLEAGLVVKSVLIVLILCSIVSWAIILKKTKLYKSLEEGKLRFMDTFRSKDSLPEVFQDCDGLEFSPQKALFVEGHKEFTNINKALGEDKEALGTHFKDYGLNILERSLRKGVHKVDEKLEDNLSTLASIGSISPFIGLFGTVWGIINSFSGLASGGATLNSVAPGIAEALVATAIGLLAAIPAVWYFNKFNNKNLSIHSEMDDFGQDFLNLIERYVAGGK